MQEIENLTVGVEALAVSGRRQRPGARQGEGQSVGKGQGECKGMVTLCYFWGPYLRIGKAEAMQGHR